VTCWGAATATQDSNFIRLSKSSIEEISGLLDLWRRFELVKSCRASIARAMQLWYNKPPAACRIIRVSSISLLGFRWCMDPLDIRGSMGIVPRHQESVPNGSMYHRELLKWHC
jgi:hypothetical protein